MFWSWWPQRVISPSASTADPATHTDHYLQFASHQPLEHKVGVIRILRYRANITVSNDKEKIQEDSHLKKVLSLAGYQVVMR